MPAGLLEVAAGPVGPAGPADRSAAKGSRARALPPAHRPSPGRTVTQLERSHHFMFGPAHPLRRRRVMGRDGSSGFGSHRAGAGPASRRGLLLGPPMGGLVH
jgi:hypothetical protein